jgi:hypothetical protein
VDDTMHAATSYITGVIDLPFPLAVAAFGACCRERQLRPGPFLELGDVPALGPRNAWCCSGRLRLGRARAVAITLELHQWSSGRSELGLRFDARKVAAAYVDAGVVVVEDLVDDMQLRGVLAMHPEHDTGVGETRATIPV